MFCAYVDGLCATKSTGLIVRAISFQDFQHNVPCGHDPPTSHADGRTDRRHCTIVHRAIKICTAWLWC